MDVFKTAHTVSAIDAAARLGLPMKRTGTRFVARCVFHEDKTPSLVLYPRDGGFHCFGCGKSGDATALYQQVLGLTPLEAARRVCGDFQLSWTDDRPSSARRKSQTEPDARVLRAKLLAFRERRAALLVERRTRAQARMTEREEALGREALPFDQWWNDPDWASANAEQLSADEELLQLDAMSLKELWEMYRSEETRKETQNG